MNEIEINELEWYFRDFLFRNYSKAVLQLKTETIPTKMIETYLRYRNADLAHTSTILGIVLENLISSKFIQRKDDFVEITDGVSRLQCRKCFYICYLGNLESKICLRCKSEKLIHSQKKSDLKSYFYT